MRQFHVVCRACELTWLADRKPETCGLCGFMVEAHRVTDGKGCVAAVLHRAQLRLFSPPEDGLENENPRGLAAAPVYGRGPQAGPERRGGS